MLAWAAPAVGNVAKTDSLEQTNTGDFLIGSEVETIAATHIEFRLEPYERAELPRPPRWAELPTETTAKWVDMVVLIADLEGPVHQDVAIDRIRDRYGMRSVRGSTREHVQRAIDSAHGYQRVQRDKPFVLLRDDQLRREPRIPVDGNIEHYPPSELRTIVIVTAKSMFGAQRRDLLIESGQALGFSRTGDRITEVIDGIIQGLLDEGKLDESFGNIYPTD